MKRQYDYSTGPGINSGRNGGGLCAKNWTNQHIFERWGDDNSVYFQDPTQQMMMNSPAPFDFSDPYFHNSNNYPSTEGPVVHVDSHESASTFLCEESQNVKRNISLAPGASVKVYLDAWEQWQTVPISVQVSSKSNKRTIKYEWKFFNYLPISGPRTEGSGEVTSGCPHISQSPPIILTLGHTNRSPTGEFPVTEATKNKKCHCASERPFIVFKNTTLSTSCGGTMSSSSSALEDLENLLIVIKIAQ